MEVFGASGKELVSKRGLASFKTSLKELTLGAFSGWILLYCFFVFHVYKNNLYSITISILHSVNEHVQLINEISLFEVNKCLPQYIREMY